MKLFKHKTINIKYITTLYIGLFLITFNSLNALTASALPPTKYTIEVDATVTGQSMGFLFGATSTGNLYMWQLNCQTANHFRLRPHIRKNGNWVFNYDVDVSTIITEATKHATHHLTINVNSDTLRTYINGTLVDTYIDKTYLKGKFGRIGLRASPTASDNENGTIDNLVIKDGNENTLYSNTFEASSTEFPDFDIISGKLQLKSGTEFGLKNKMWTTKYTIDTDFTAISSSVGFLFSALDNDNLIMWQFNIEQTHARFRPQKRINGSWSTIKETDLSTIIPDDKKNATHHMKIDVQGTSIVTYFDGLKADSAVVEEFGYGSFGFRYAGEDGTFDNIVIKDSLGKILYANDFNHNPPFNFPTCISVDGKLRNGIATTEFSLYTPSSKILVNEVVSPKTQMGQLGDTISVKLASFTETTLKNLAIHYQVNSGAIANGIVDSIQAFSSIIYTFPQKQALNRHFPDADTVTVWTVYDTTTTYIVNYKAGSDWALNYTGSGGKRVQINNNPSINPDIFTIEAWVYPVAFRDNVYEGNVISNQSDTYSGYALQIGSPNGEISFEVGTSFGWESANGGANSLVLNQWQHIAGVFSGDSIKVYVNGILKGAKKISGKLSKSTSPLIIGASPAWPGGEFNGKIDEASIWNMALSNKQICSTVNIHPVGNELGLTAYYRFNEGPGATIVGDSSGNGNYGTIVNFTDLNKAWVFGKTLPARVLEVPTLLHVDAAEGSMVSYIIHSNTNWNTTNLPEWLLANPTNGTTDSLSVTLTAKANYTTSARSAATIISDGFVEKTIQVTQDAAVQIVEVPSAIGLSQLQNSKYKFAIVSNVNWDITDIAAWLIIDKTSGLANDSITIETLSANNLANSRIDTVWVSHGAINKPIIISQLGTAPNLVVITPEKLSPYARNTQKIALTTNRSWEVKAISNPLWLSISPLSGSISTDVTLNVSANKSGITRKDTITFSADTLVRKVIVIQEAASVKVPATMVIGATEASYQDFDITSNVDWTIQLPNSSSWLSTNVFDNTGNGNRTVRLTALLNPKNINRIAKVYISSAFFDIKDSITVTQLASNSYLIVDSSIIHFGSASKLINSFVVKTNSNNLTVTTKTSTWFTIAIVGISSNNSIITLTATENKSFSIRKDTIFIGGALKDTIIVTQAATTPILYVSSLSPAYIEDTAGSETTFAISSNVSWSIKGLSSWLTASKTEGSGSTTITLTALANVVNTSRRDTVKIIGTDGVSEQLVIVLQTRAAAFITTSVTILNIKDTINSEALFDIASNTAWTANSKQTWLTISPASGTGNATGIKMKATANASTALRTTIVIISGAGVSDTITVTQESKPNGIANITEGIASVYPNPTSGIFNIMLGNAQNNTDVQIYNAIGVLVKTVNLQKSNITVDITDIANGMYIVKVVSGNSIQLIKITKN